MLTLEPTPKIITFDCYGTLVQWRRAVRNAARSILSAHLGTCVPEAQAAALADGIRVGAVDHQQRPPYRSYAAVLRASLKEALAAIGYEVTEDDHRTLWATLSRIEPHPDAPAALARLRAITDSRSSATRTMSLIRSVWIDREGEPLNADWRPDAVLPDLSALPELLLAS